MLRTMRVGRHEIWPIAGALALHAAAFWLLATLAGVHPVLPSVAGSSESISFDIEFDQGNVAESAPGATEVGQGAAEVRFTRSVARPLASEPASGTDPGTIDSEEGREELEVARSEEAPSRGPIDLGIGSDGWQRWVSPSGASQAARVDRRPRRSNRFNVFHAPPVSTTGGLQEGLEERDRERGLGPSGRVLSVLHQAAHAEVAPALGTARFDVTVLRTGAVEVTLRAASGEVERWRKVATYIATELRTLPPRIPAAREGVKLQVELVAEETMPNGTKVSSLGPPHLDAPPMKLQSTAQAKKRLQADNPTTESPDGDSLPAINVEQPGLYIAERGKVADFRVGLALLPPGAQSHREGVTPLGLSAQGHFEPAHIGAKSQRTVHARVIEQSMF
jgi:hypothetical protein